MLDICGLVVATSVRYRTSVQLLTRSCGQRESRPLQRRQP